MQISRVAWIALSLTLGVGLLPPTVQAREVTVVVNGWVQGNLRVPPPLAGGQAETQTVLRSLRQQDPGLFLLSSGNMLGPSATSNADQGAAVVELMNLAGYDAMAVGPHDLFAGTGALLTRATEARFPMIWTNLARKGLDQRWDPIPDHAWVSRGGKRILVLGLISPRLISEWPGWRHVVGLDDPAEAAARLESEASKADFVVALTSMGLQENMGLLGKIPWIDLVVTQQLGSDEGWDFSSFQLERDDGRRILWTSCYGTRLGKVRLDRRDAVLDSSAERVSLNGVLPDPGAMAIVERIEAVSHHSGGAVMTTLGASEIEDFPGLLLDALRAEMNAEVAILHRGALKAESPEAALSESSLRNAFPFPDKVARLSVAGSLLRILWSRRNDSVINNKGLVLAGLEERRGVLLVNGRPVEDEEMYRLATVEFLALGALGLLPRSPEKIHPEEFVDLLVRHFQRAPEVRHRMVRRIASKAIRRIDTQLDWSYNRLNFGGAADRYQFKAPATLFAASDIPGFVGQEHDLLNFSFRHERVADRPNSDTTLRLSANLSKFLGTKTVDRSDLLVRKEAKDEVGNPTWFAEAKFTGTVQDPGVAGQDRPLFGKAVLGKVLRPSEEFKLFLGAGNVVRFSQPGDPSDVGVNLGFEFARDLTERVNFTSRLDSFAGVGGDHLRTFDLSSSLRTEVARGVSVVTRHTRFGWRDDTVGRSGNRDEFYVGLGFGLGARRY